MRRIYKGKEEFSVMFYKHVKEGKKKHFLFSLSLSLSKSSFVVAFPSVGPREAASLTSLLLVLLLLLLRSLELMLLLLRSLELLHAPRVLPLRLEEVEARRDALARREQPAPVASAVAAAACPSLVLDLLLLMLLVYALLLPLLPPLLLPLGGLVKFPALGLLRPADVFALVALALFVVIGEECRRQTAAAAAALARRSSGSTPFSGSPVPLFLSLHLSCDFSRPRVREDDVGPQRGRATGTGEVVEGPLQLGAWHLLRALLLPLLLALAAAAAVTAVASAAVASAAVVVVVVAVSVVDSVDIYLLNGSSSAARVDGAAPLGVQRALGDLERGVSGGLPGGGFGLGSGGAALGRLGRGAAGVVVAAASLFFSPPNADATAAKGARRGTARSLCDGVVDARDRSRGTVGEGAAEAHRPPRKGSRGSGSVCGSSVADERDGKFSLLVLLPLPPLLPAVGPEVLMHSPQRGTQRGLAQRLRVVPLPPGSVDCALDVAEVADGTRVRDAVLVAAFAFAALVAAVPRVRGPGVGLPPLLDEHLQDQAPQQEPERLGGGFTAEPGLVDEAGARLVAAVKGVEGSRRNGSSGGSSSITAAGAVAAAQRAQTRNLRPFLHRRALPRVGQHLRVDRRGGLRREVVDVRQQKQTAVAGVVLLGQRGGPVQRHGVAAEHGVDGQGRFRCFERVGMRGSEPAGEGGDPGWDWERGEHFLREKRRLLRRRRQRVAERVRGLGLPLLAEPVEGLGVESPRVVEGAAACHGVEVEDEGRSGGGSIAVIVATAVVPVIASASLSTASDAPDSDARSRGRLGDVPRGPDPDHRSGVTDQQQAPMQVVVHGHEHEVSREHVDVFRPRRDTGVGARRSGPGVGLCRRRRRRGEEARVGRRPRRTGLALRQFLEEERVEKVEARRGARGRLPRVARRAPRQTSSVSASCGPAPRLQILLDHLQPQVDAAVVEHAPRVEAGEIGSRHAHGPRAARGGEDGGERAVALGGGGGAAEGGAGRASAGGAPEAAGVAAVAAVVPGGVEQGGDARHGSRGDDRRSRSTNSSSTREGGSGGEAPPAPRRKGRRAGVVRVPVAAAAVVVPARGPRLEVAFFLLFLFLVVVGGGIDEVDRSLVEEGRGRGLGDGGGRRRFRGGLPRRPRPSAATGARSLLLLLKLLQVLPLKLLQLLPLRFLRVPEAPPADDVGVWDVALEVGRGGQHRAGLPPARPADAADFGLRQRRRRRRTRAYAAAAEG